MNQRGNGSVETVGAVGYLSLMRKVGLGAHEGLRHLHDILFCIHGLVNEVVGLVSIICGLGVSSIYN
jgi:hypothetical protein